MYDIDYKNLKKGYRFGIPFFLVGLLFVVIGIFICFGGMIKKTQLDSEVEAYEVDPGKHRDSEDGIMYSPIYYFEVDGESYQCGITGSSSIAVSSKNKMVYYDSEDPNNCVTDYETSPSIVMFIFPLMGAVFCFIGFKQMKNVSDRIKRMKKLATNGTLYKGLKYDLVESGMAVNGIPVLCPQVDFQLPSGSTIKLTGDARHDGRTYDADGLVDLLIDPTDPSLYYIDFEINRKY